MTKLERAKEFLHQTARPGLRVLSLALLATSAYAIVSISGTVFNVSGTFDDGGDTLSGTITIDTVGGGGILSEDLMVTSPTYTFDSYSGLDIQEISDSGTFYDTAVMSGSPNSQLDLNIYLGAVNGFSGYTGGTLCDDKQTCGGIANETSFTVESEGNLQQPADPPLGSGMLSLATPEPSTALLIMGGGAAVLALRRRKRA
jgi:hypothetical protein